MEIITSVSNQYVKHTRSLKNKKARDEHREFVIEGKKLVLEALKEKVTIKYALVDEKCADLQDFCAIQNIEYYIVASNILPALTDTQAPQGMVCVCEQCTQDFALPQGNSLILDHLQDPGNLGAIIRSAAAFNFTDIYLIDCVDAYSEKVVRSSMGNMFKVILHKTDFITLSSQKKAMKSTFLVADMFGKKIGDNCLPKSRFAVIIGNEGKGVSKELVSLADDTISIPMHNGVESLNASVSASIIMYYISQGD